MALIDANQFFAELEETGEDEIRKHRASDAIYGSGKRELVDEWLRRKDQERSDTVKREQIEIARDAASSARDAAASTREAAREAREANKIAKRANRIAIAAIAAAIISAIISFAS